MKKANLFASALMAGLITADQQAAAADPYDCADCYHSSGITTCMGTFNGFREHDFLKHKRKEFAAEHRGVLSCIPSGSSPGASPLGRFFASPLR